MLVAMIIVIMKEEGGVTQEGVMLGENIFRHGCLKHETRFYHFISNFNNF